MCMWYTATVQRTFIMPTQTRASTGTATKVALGIAIGASAAFAAVSLNSSMMKKSFTKNPSIQQRYDAKRYGSSGGSVESAEACINRCLMAQSECQNNGKPLIAQCIADFDRCVSYCPSEKTPGYMVPGYVPPAPPAPGYMPAGYVPGYVPPAPGYVPPAVKKTPTEDLPPGYMWPGGLRKEQPKK